MTDHCTCPEVDADTLGAIYDAEGPGYYTTDPACPYHGEPDSDHDYSEDRMRAKLEQAEFANDLSDRVRTP